MQFVRRHCRKYEENYRKDKTYLQVPAFNAT